MPKNFHEFRDPIHVFIKATSHERAVIDSTAFQRLRNIHQLALTYLVYPGATHCRFEHCLGVMEVASRIFDVVTGRNNVTNEVRKQFPALDRPEELNYWRTVIRMAALCHDLGHLPFSHAAEKELLPQGVSHESLSAKLIRSPEIREILESGTPPVKVEDVVKLAVGQKDANKIDPPVKLNTWEQVLAEIIVGDAFGADRIDYLLRDSHHAGVAYGRFDHYRLIDTLRILPSPPAGQSDEASQEPQLGVEEGGLRTAESLMLARYFMFSQLYFHRVRRIYDIHLRDFLMAWLPEGKYSIEVKDHLRSSDNRVLTGMYDALDHKDRPTYIHAKRILCREHFRPVWERNPTDIKVNLDAGRLVYESISEKFGVENVRRDSYPPKAVTTEFPVKVYDGNVFSSTALSHILQNVPQAVVDFVFVEKSRVREVKEWLNANKDNIITPIEEKDDG